MRTEEAKPGDELAKPVEALTEASQVVDNQAGDLRDSVGAKVDDTLAGKERIDLGIDWDSIDKESLFASMKTFDYAENLYSKVPGKRKHDTYLVYSSELNTNSGNKVKLNILKVISPNFHEMQIEIIRPDLAESMPHRYVADFDFLQLKHDQFPKEVDEGCEEWDMKHRQTQPVYRKQGVAEKVLDILGEILKRRSQDNNISQSISAKSGQRDLTEWLENKKRGFKPATPQDTEMFKRLQATDNDLQDVTVNGETYTFNAKEFKLKFPELSGPEDPAVWDFDNYEKPFFYMKSCFKIKMKKSV